MAAAILDNKELRDTYNHEPFFNMIKASDTLASFTNKLSSRPELKGSEKQINWANDIREKFIKEQAWSLTVCLVFIWEEHLRAGKTELDEDKANAFNKRGNALVKASKMTSASWWINESSGFTFDYISNKLKK